jgi:hypothetical protein
MCPFCKLGVVVAAATVAWVSVLLSSDTEVDCGRKVPVGKL